MKRWKTLIIQVKNVLTNQITVLSYPVSEDELNSDGSEEEQTEAGQFGLKQGAQKRYGWTSVQLEKEWSRREVAIEQATWRHSYNPVCAGDSYFFPLFFQMQVTSSFFNGCNIRVLSHPTQPLPSQILQRD